MVVPEPSINVDHFYFMANYRKIWENANGSIPKDEYGRSYEIHHIDGNRKNNELSNLMCVSIKEHYEIHKNQKDFGSAFIIAQRMNLTLEEMQELTQKMADNKRGKSSKNKGKTGIFNDDARKKLSDSVKKLYEDNPSKKLESVTNLRRGIEKALQKNPNLFKKYKEENPFFGKHHSEETKELIRQKLKNRIPWNKGKSKNSHKNETNI